MLFRSITECLADDPQARGGTATHPMTLQLFFMFYGDRLHTFTSTPRSSDGPPGRTCGGKPVLSAHSDPDARC